MGNLTITAAAINATREDLGVEIGDPIIGAALVTSSPSAITYAFRASFEGRAERDAATALGVDAVRWVTPEDALPLLDDEGRSCLRYLTMDADRKLILARQDASSEFAEVDYA